MWPQPYLAFTRYCFTLRLLCTNQSSVYCPPPTCIPRTIAILLHVYSAVYDAPPTHLLYAIHHTILAMAISCKGHNPYIGVNPVGLTPISPIYIYVCVQLYVYVYTHTHI